MRYVTQREAQLLTEKQRMQTALRQQKFRERQKEARRGEQAAKGLPLLPSIPSLPGTHRWKATLRSAQALVAQVSEEMQQYSDNRSEDWHESERAEIFAERLAEVEAVLSQLDDLTD